jgi:3-hydroxyisobutyrate dehydrogenase-like beta-hydroxyacid dehydrogenase
MTLVVAVLGLGEAGACIAADLLAVGATVRGFDPRGAALPGMIVCDSDSEAAEGSDVVIALTSAHQAEETLRLALPGMRPGGLYADLNTASSGLKQTLAAIAEAAGVVFSDIALMSPVPGKGLHTPMLACGPGAERYAAIFELLGASVELVEGPPGTAAARKLIRSVFYKGLAAAVTESLRAAQVAGCEDWVRTSIGTELAMASALTVDRLEQGSKQHARRRVDEMAAASAFLDELGVPSRVSRASRDWLEQLLGEHSSAAEVPR